MNTKLIILCLLLLVFSSCTLNNSQDENGTNQVDTKNTEVFLMSTEDSNQIQQNNTSWIDAYIGVVESIASNATHITLLDIDFDNIPELFLSKLGASNSCIYHGFTYKDGKVSDITIVDGFIPTDLELYREKNTNEQFWIANGMFRSVAKYDYVWYKIDFSNFNEVKTDLIFSYREDLEGVDSDHKAIYSLIDSSNSETIMTQDEIYDYKKTFFSKYERIETLDMFSFIDDFVNKDDTSSEEKIVNKDLLYNFLKLYESTKQLKPLYDPEHPLNLPVYSILNFNTYSHS